MTIDGHGSRNEYFNSSGSEFEKYLVMRLRPVVEYINQECGKDNWVALTGGDPYQGDKVRDTGVLLHVLQKHFGVPCIAVQCSNYAGYIFEPAPDGGPPASYEYLRNGAVFPYYTTYTTDSAGMNEIEFGGYNRDGELVGASIFWFHKEVRDLVEFDIAAGGGPIALNNINQCLFGNESPQEQQPLGSPLRRQSVPSATHVLPPEDSTEDSPRVSTRFFQPIRVLYLPFHVKNCGPGRENGTWLGQVHDYLKQHQVRKMVKRPEKVLIGLADNSPDSVWIIFDPRPRAPKKRDASRDASPDLSRE